MSGTEPFASPRSAPPSRPVATAGAGVLAVLLGLWDLIGGGCGALGLAFGGRGEVPDSPLFTAAQLRAIEAFTDAAATLDPVNAAVGMLVGLVGILLLAGGFLQFTSSGQRGLVGRVAFGASIAVDGLQIVWGIAWYLLLWQPLRDYVEAISRTMPDQPPDMESVVGVATGLSVVLMVLLSAVYFGGKMALAGWGFWRCTRADRDLDGGVEAAAVSGAAEQVAPVEPERAQPAPRNEEGLSWAVDPVDQPSDEADEPPDQADERDPPA